MSKWTKLWIRNWNSYKLLFEIHMQASVSMVPRWKRLAITNSSASVSQKILSGTNILTKLLQKQIPLSVKVNSTTLARSTWPLSDHSSNTVPLSGTPDLGSRTTAHTRSKWCSVELRDGHWNDTTTHPVTLRYLITWTGDPLNKQCRVYAHLSLLWRSTRLLWMFPETIYNL